MRRINVNVICVSVRPTFAVIRSKVKVIIISYRYMVRKVKDICIGLLQIHIWLYLFLF